MSVKKIFISSVATLTIIFASAVVGEGKQYETEEMLEKQKRLVEDQGAPVPETVKAPAPNIEEQEKTEKMVKEQKRLAEEGAPVPESVEAMPSPTAQEKTGEMLEKQKALDPND